MERCENEVRREKHVGSRPYSPAVYAASPTRVLTTFQRPRVERTFRQDLQRVRPRRRETDLTLMTARVGTTTTPLPPPGRACSGDPHPRRSSPQAAVEAWSAPVRRPPAHHRFRTPGNWKVRPRTPKLRGVTPASTAQRVWADLQHAGDLRPHFGLSVFPATGLSRLTPPHFHSTPAGCAALSSLAGLIVGV